MACTQTLSSITTGCEGVVGGLVEVYAHNKADIASITVSDGKVSAFALANLAPSAAKLAFRKQTGSMTSTWKIDDTAGVRYVTTELALRFAKMETAKRTSLMALAQAETILIVKDQNGKYWLMGKDNPVTISAGTGETGTAHGDANQYTINLQDLSSEMPFEVADAAVTTFLNE